VSFYLKKKMKKEQSILFAIFTVLFLFQLGLVSTCAQNPVRETIREKIRERIGQTGQQTAKGATEYEIEFGGLKRKYFVFAPKDFKTKKNLPLLFVLHGGGGQGDRLDGLTKFSQMVESKNFIAVYPNGIENRWNDGRETIPRKEIDDVGFIKILLETISKNHPVDQKRVYAAGISNGGMMSLYLACQMPDKIAAVAAVAANMPVNMAANCQKKKPLSVMFIAGKSDPIMPYKGGIIYTFGGRGIGGNVVSIRESVDFWIKQNQIKSAPQISEIPDSDPNDGTRTSREIYSNAKNGTEVILYATENGGHTWAGGIQYQPETIIGKTSRDFNASEVIWEFLSKQKL
jgi:polyhydroxybutyrate depolymerase